MFCNHNLIDIKKLSVHVENSKDTSHKRLAFKNLFWGEKTTEQSSIDVNKIYVNVITGMNFSNHLDVSLVLLTSMHAVITLNRARN